MKMQNVPVKAGPHVGEFNSLDYIIIGVCTVLSVGLFPIWFFLGGIKIVREYEGAIVFRLGKIMNAKGFRGLVLNLPCIDDVRKVDQRTVSVDVPAQQILTKDQISVMVDAVVDYYVSDTLSAVAGVENYSASTLMMAQTTLRNTLGEYTLQGILLGNDIAKRVTTQLDKVTDPWGIKVIRVNLKNISLPVDMRRSMAASAEERQTAKARVRRWFSVTRHIHIRYICSENTCGRRKRSSRQFEIGFRRVGKVWRNYST